MGISWVGGTTSAYVASDTSLSANLPSGLADDDGVFAFLMTRSAVTLPAGWTLLGAVSFTGSGVTQTLGVYRKESVAAGDAGTSVTWQQASAGRMGVTYAAARASADRVLMAELQTAAYSEVSASLFAVPVVTATSEGELCLLAASVITALSGSASITPPVGATLWSGAVAENRLGGAYLACDTDEASGGSFAFYQNSTGAGTLALRLFEGAESARLALPSPLGAPALLAAPGVAWLALPSPLGAPALLAARDVLGKWRDDASPAGVATAFGSVAPAALITLPGPLTAATHPARVLAQHDFSAALSGTEYWVLDITGSPTLRVPVSSWQASAQIGRSQFVQAVIPAASAYAEALSTRAADGEDMVISRGLRLADGSTYEYEMVRAAISRLRIDYGALNYSATLQAYFAAAAAVDDPGAYARTLSAVRSVTIDEGVRVRCAIDWLLRPGHQVSAAGQTFNVDYINYYVSPSDRWMDVGQRAVDE